MDMSLSKLWKMVQDRETWRAAIHGVAKSQTRLSDWTETRNLMYLFGYVNYGKSCISRDLVSSCNSRSIQVEIRPFGEGVRIRYRSELILTFYSIVCLFYLTCQVSFSIWIQFSSVAHHVRLFATLWTATRQASLSHHQLPKLTQTHVHWVSDTNQPSHPLSSPSLPTFNLSQHQGLFWWVSSGQSIGVLASASVLPMNIQDWFPLGWTDWISSQSKGLSRVFSNTTVQKHQFFGAQLSV